MYFIVESESQLERLESLGRSCDCFVDVITTNDNYHPKMTGLVAVYIRPFIEDETDPSTGAVIRKAKGYILPISHSESLQIDREHVQQVLEKFSTVWVINKKKFLYHFNLRTNVKDISLKYSMLMYDKLQVTSEDTTVNWFYNRYGDLADINQIIPIAKLYQNCEKRYRQVAAIKIDESLIFDVSDPDGFEFYNTLATKVFYMVEQAGLRVDVHNFESRFKPTNSNFSISGETVYTSYNLYNTTSRPTNAFNSVNFLAIPKGQEFRRCFKPSTPGGKFAEIDWDGYHIRLVSSLVDYPLDSKVKAHKQIAKLRTGTDELNHEEYVQAKADNFKMIYGSPSEQDSKLDISQKVQSYINKLWKEFKEEGKVIDKLSGKAFTSKLEEMYPNKLFNYTIQCLETSRNILILYKVLSFLAKNNYESKVVLVTYDCFLLDVVRGEEEVIKEVQKIMEAPIEGMGSVFPAEAVTSIDLNFD